VTRSQFARLAVEAFLPLLRSDKISRMELKVLFSEDPAFVLRRADEFLSSEPVLHNLILSILHSRVTQGDPGRYWIASHREKTVGVVAQSPIEYPATLTPMGPRAVLALVDAIAEAGVTLPGVNGEAATAASFAGQWSERCKSAAVPFQGTRLYELLELGEVPRTEGQLRQAGPRDRSLMILWTRAFQDEIGESSNVAFECTDLWNSAADFKTQTGANLGFTLARESEGTSRLQVYFEPAVDPNSRVLFLRYVHDHLTQQAQNVLRLRHYWCVNKKCKRFNHAFADQDIIDEALAPEGKAEVFCPKCGRPIKLRDTIEEKFDSPGMKEQARELDAEAQVVIDNESRELMAVHHAGFIVSEAGQIYRGYTNSDHGIDGEIEFKDDQGRASGMRLYVQLKSGDSYLKKRQRDGAEVFHIKNPRWADYWQQQSYAVMLVIRTSDGEIRWMDVSAYLKRESVGGRTVKQIVFAGERFDVMSVRRWRNSLLIRKSS